MQISSLYSPYSGKEGQSKEKKKTTAFTVSNSPQDLSTGAQTLSFLIIFQNRNKRKAPMAISYKSRPQPNTSNCPFSFSHSSPLEEDATQGFETPSSHSETNGHLSKRLSFSKTMKMDTTFTMMNMGRMVY